MTTRILIFLSFFFVLSILCNEQPGLRIGFSEEALRSIEKNYLPQILKNITSQELPPIEFKKSEPFFGDFLLQINNIRMNITDVDYNKLDVSFNNNSITVVLKVKTVKVNFNFTVKSDFYLNQNTGSAVLADVDLVLVQRLYSLKNIHSTAYRDVYGPGLLIESMTLNDFDFDLQLGGDSNLVTLITKGFEKLRPTLKDNIRSFLKSGIPSANMLLTGLLSSIDLSVKIYSNPEVYLDLSLINEPVIQDKMLELSFNSTVFSQNKSVPVFRNISIPRVNKTSQQIQLYLSENVVNSILLSAKEIKLLDVTLLYEMTEKVFKLDTTNLGILLPNLTLTYGLGKKIDLACSAPEAPKAFLSQEKIGADLTENCKMMVRLDNGTSSVAFEFVIRVDMIFKLNLVEGVLKFEIVDLVISEFKVVQTNIGNIDAEKIRNGINFWVATGLTPINEYIKNGITLPNIEGLSFTEATINSRDGYLAVEMNPKFAQALKRILTKRMIKK